MSEFIRVSTKEQIELSAKLAEEIWSEYYTPIIGKEQVEYMIVNFQSEKAIVEQIDSGSWVYYLIYDMAKAVGYFAFQVKLDEIFLSKLYLTDHNRGQGIARKVVKFLENVTAENCLNKISLTVNKNNKGAIAAYEKLGFVNIEAAITDIGNGFVMDDFIMEKKLAAMKFKEFQTAS